MFIWERLLVYINGELYCIFIENEKNKQNKNKR